MILHLCHHPFQLVRDKANRIFSKYQIRILKHDFSIISQYITDFFFHCYCKLRITILLYSGYYVIFPQNNVCHFVNKNFFQEASRKPIRQKIVFKDGSVVATRSVLVLSIRYLLVDFTNLIFHRFPFISNCFTQSPPIKKSQPHKKSALFVFKF